MRVQDWIFSVRCHDDPRLDGLRRGAVVGPACASTVEAALHLAEVPEAVRAEIRTCSIVRDFVDGRLDPDKAGLAQSVTSSWIVCIGSVQEVLP